MTTQTEQLVEEARRLAGKMRAQHWMSIGHVARTVDALANALSEYQERERRWLEWSGGEYPDDSPGDVISADVDGTIVLDDGITTWNPLRALDFLAAQPPSEVEGA